MYIIAGLGNPTKEYEKTRHNAGFDAIDVLAEKHGIQITERKHKAFCGTGFIGGERVLLAKPQTFMNLSGESVREAAQAGRACGRRRIFTRSGRNRSS